MSRLIRTLRSERLLPVLAGVVALAMVAVVVVIATGGDEAEEPVAVPAAERVKPAGGDATGKPEPESKPEQREERQPERADQSEPERSPSPEPEPPEATGDGGGGQDADSTREFGRKVAEEAELSCAEQEELLNSGDETQQRFLRQWFGSGCK